MIVKVFIAAGAGLIIIGITGIIWRIVKRCCTGRERGSSREQAT